ncbi:MAG TPA: choice-of-anchor Q domain-containing protein [Solirubrobacteraceae bacterium]
MSRGGEVDRSGPALWRRAARAALALVVVITAAAVLPASALATLWVSSSGTDTGYCSQANPCATLSRAVSLAIPNDTIYVGPGTISDHVTIDPSITGLTIQGSGVDATTISGGVGQSGSVITVQMDTTVTINDLTITGGNALGFGGGVNNAGNLTMQRDEVGFNTASPNPGISLGLGGGVFSGSDDANDYLTITDSTIIANRASDDGGGIYMLHGTLDRDVINNNRVVSGGGEASAGGVYVGQTTLNDDTIFGNQVTNSAGSAVGDAGGLYAYLSTVTDTTIARNFARTAGGFDGDNDKLTGLLLSGNTGGNCRPNTAGPQSLGYNLSDDTTCGLAHTGDINGVNAQLEDLADNAGPTETMAIPSSSPAYDANVNCSGTDERGVSFLQRGATRCDMGAYQVDAPSTYVANPAGDSVTAYATGATGNVAPVLRLAGSATGLSQPTGVVVDVQGRVYVTNPAANAITEYAPEVTGNVAPVARIAGGATRLSAPQGLALDGSGHLWVASGNGVSEFAAGANGNVAPIARIIGSNTRLPRPHALVIGPGGDVQATTSNAAITTYPAGATGNVAPIRRIVPGAAKRLTTPQGLNINGAGNLVVADSGAGRVDTFSASATGAAKPLSVLSGSMSAPIGLDLDVFDDVFVADSTANSIDEYAAGASGAAGTIAQISGSATGLDNPAFLSELPPPPVPHIHVRTHKRQPRKRLLADGIVLRIKASGRFAFRAEPVNVRAVARVGHRIWATARPLALRPGTTILHLVPVKRAARMLSRRHRTQLNVTVMIRGGFGTHRSKLTIAGRG